MSRFLLLCVAATVLLMPAMDAYAGFFSCGHQRYRHKPKLCPDGSIPLYHMPLPPMANRGQTLFDAIAVDDATLRLGICLNQPSLNRAELCALSICTRDGGAACRSAVHGAARGGYGAVVIGRNSYTGKAALASIWGYKSVVGADQMAARGCNNEDGQQCRLVAHWYEGRPGVYRDGY